MGFFDEEDSTEEVEGKINNEEKNERKRPYAIWTVAGREFKLKLTTAVITELEKKYKTNLLNVLGSGQGGMPALTVMLDITHGAMKKFEHGIKRDDVTSIFDKYTEEGGSQLNFYTEVYMDIFAVSGFFSDSLTEKMEETLEEAKEVL